MQFTSHYVSINSHQINSYHTSQIYLHPTMYLLIRTPPYCLIQTWLNLHPTMYLLIPDANMSNIATLINLHPTMYLLIRFYLFDVCSYFTDLHPTMYLLIPTRWEVSLVSGIGFTSHYVSINSQAHNPSTY